MTFCGNNFKHFPQNQLTNFRAVETVLKQSGPRVLLLKQDFPSVTTVNINSLNTDTSRGIFKILT